MNIWICFNAFRSFVIKPRLKWINLNIWTNYLRHQVPSNGSVRCNSNIFVFCFFSVMSLLFLADPMSLAHSKWCRQCFEWNYREMNVSNITLKEGASSEHDFQLMFVLGKKKNSEFVNNSNNKYMYIKCERMHIIC